MTEASKYNFPKAEKVHSSLVHQFESSDGDRAIPVIQANCSISKH